MINRKILEKLDLWRKTKGRKCLILQGARQVGKTFAVRMFAARRYEELLEISFKETPSAKEIFSGELTVDRMIMALRFRYPEKAIDPEKTLIFLDEIQECPEAITSLKFWTQNGKYNIIASGSLLGIDHNRASSYPVGYVEYLKMHGLDLQEFFAAFGIGDDLTGMLKDCLDRSEPVPPAVHSSCMGISASMPPSAGCPKSYSATLTCEISALWIKHSANCFRAIDMTLRTTQAPMKRKKPRNASCLLQGSFLIRKTTSSSTRKWNTAEEHKSITQA